ncbi:hypothetical protein JB92DRAFT_2844476, partial [Gautieria morchelliformis]
MPQLSKCFNNSAETSQYLYHGRGSKPLHHIQTPQATNDDDSDTPSAALLIPYFDKDTLNVTDVSQHLFLATEKASRLLLSFLAANIPWKVTAGFLFDICHILEDTLTLFGIFASSPSSIMLIPVLRTIRIWRGSACEGRNLENLASDLAGLISVELSTRKPMHATILKCDSAEELQQMSLGTAPQDKENVLSTRPPQHRRHRTQKTAKRKTRNTYLNDLPDNGLSSPFPYGSREVFTSGTHPHFARPLCDAQGHAEPPPSLMTPLSSHFADESGGLRGCIKDTP